MGTSKNPEDFVSRLGEDRPPGMLVSPLAAGPAATEQAFDVTPVEDPANPLTSKIKAARYNFDHKVFVIWRPYNVCYRCLSKLKTDPPTLDLPDDGDYTCPHNSMKEYRALLDERARGLCKFTSYEPMTLRDGVIQVSIGLARPKTKEELEQMAEKSPRTRGKF